MVFTLFTPEILFFTAVFALSALSCWAFSRFGAPFFVAKPRDWTPERHHQTKQGIPTMGGLVLIWVWILGIMSPYAPIPWGSTGLALLIVLAMGFLGAYDDWSKINRWGGISAGAKFIAQNIFALSAVGIWYWSSPAATSELWIPLFNVYLPIGAFIILWGALVIVSASNAVNLTDGLDGLAGTVLTLCFGAIAWQSHGPTLKATAHMDDVAAIAYGDGGSCVASEDWCAYSMGHGDVFFGSLLAAAIMLGFLWLNRHPARLFMGDTGALAFGALLGLYAVQLNITLLLPLIAIVPVIETLSVMLQVAWYKRYKTRLFKMAPLHHHFELIGYSENQIVAYAGLITFLGCLLAGLFFYFKN
jgi:phospho-N-acetylmuramoyl-pentapeptide-transferase